MEGRISYALPCLGFVRLLGRYEVSVLAKVCQVLDVVFRCRNPASVAGGLEGEDVADPVEVV